MKSSLLLFAAASILTLGGQAHAANRDVSEYLQRASEAASAKVAAAGVDVSSGLKVAGHVDADGRLSGVRVVTSSGSLETDQKAAAALKRLRVAAPPAILIGAQVNVALGPQPIVTAKAP